jgi:hypothetical protein
MPIAVGETVNGLVDAFIGLPAVKTICGNPIYTSLFIGFLTVVCVLFVFRAEDVEKLLALRCGFIMAIMSACLMVIHNKILIDQEHAKRLSADVGDLYASLGTNTGTTPAYAAPPAYVPPPAAYTPPPTL